MLAWDSAVSLWKNKPLPDSSITSSVTKTANYTIVPTDYVIRVNASSNAVTITLPSAVTNTGKTFIVKRIDSSANNVTIATTSAQTIDGSTTVLVNLQYTSITVHSNGTSWDII